MQDINLNLLRSFQIVVEEADETLLWLEMISEAGISVVEESLMKEAKEVLYIMAASRKSAQGK